MNGRRFSLSADGKFKLRDFEAEREARWAEEYLTALNAAGVGSPRLIRREGRRLVMEYVRGAQLVGWRGLLQRREIAALLARVHGIGRLDRPAAEGLAGYRECAVVYLQRYVEHGLLERAAADALLERLMRVAPRSLFAALVHNDVNRSNLLTTPAGLVLIDYAGVRPLSLEHDLLNASRALLSPFESRLLDHYSLNGHFARCYRRCSPRADAIFRSALAGRRFYEAYNRVRKGSNALTDWGGNDADQARFELSRVLRLLD